MNLRHAHVTCTLGELDIIAEGGQVTGLFFADHLRRPPKKRFGALINASDDPILGRAEQELREYLAGDLRVFTVPMAPAGDEFSRRVWQRLSQIPYGETTTYGSLAHELGNRHLAQRVGQAVGRNPICVFIPCHRVLGADGTLTGYAGGLERKRALLTVEEPPVADTSRLF